MNIKGMIIVLISTKIIPSSFISFCVPMARRFSVILVHCWLYRLSPVHKDHNNNFIDGFSGDPVWPIACRSCCWLRGATMVFSFNSLCINSDCTVKIALFLAPSIFSVIKLYLIFKISYAQISIS